LFPATDSRIITQFRNRPVRRHAVWDSSPGNGQAVTRLLPHVLRMPATAREAPCFRARPV